MNYEYIKNYQTNDELMESYFEFTQKVFGFDLKKWRSEGFWNNDYIPHSLIYNNQVIANVSVAKMKLQINGKKVKGVQLGSVGVLPEYRGKGLSRILMEKVLEEYKDYPITFLFTTQENYYQRFGFEKFDEVIPYINISDNDRQTEPTKLTLKDEAIDRLLNGKLQHSFVLDAKGNTMFNWFHLMYIHRENIYYIEELDVIFIATYEGDTVDVYEILSEKKIDFKELQEYIIKTDTKKVRFHFTPDWLNISQDLCYDKLPSDEGSIFILGEFPDNITNFKFPAMSQT